MRYLASFFLTTFIYTALAVVFLFAIPFNTPSIKNEKKKEVSLNYVKIIKPKKKKAIESIEKKLEKPIKKQEIKKELIKESKRIVKSKSKKVVKKRNKKTIKKVKIKQKKIVKQVELKKTIKEKVEKTVSTEIYKPSVKKESREEYKKAFLRRNLALIKKHIQSQIKYSKRARRMNIQGDVRVRFLLKKDGTVINIVALEGHRLLRKSTIKAINEASKYFPSVQKNITITIPIQYRLI